MTEINIRIKYKTGEYEPEELAKEIKQFIFDEMGWDDVEDSIEYEKQVETEWVEV